jgi:hypothetical protein
VDFRNKIERMGKDNMPEFINFVNRLTEGTANLQKEFRKSEPGKVSTFNMHSSAANFVGTLLEGSSSTWNGSAFKLVLDFRSMLDNVIAEHQNDSSVFNNRELQKAFEKLDIMVKQTVHDYEMASKRQ